MIRSILLVLGLSVLSACFPVQSKNTIALGPDGKPLPRLYRIHERHTDRVQISMLDGINSLRQVKGLSKLKYDALLNAAAATHARDMAIQNRPWHFGSDGSSPIDRLHRVGYTGQLLGENISETYESELETLASWMLDEGTRNVILDRRATDIGFAWFQEEKGKIWWTLVVANAHATSLAELGPPNDD